MNKLNLLTRNEAKQLSESNKDWELEKQIHVVGDAISNATYLAKTKVEVSRNVNGLNPVIIKIFEELGYTFEVEKSEDFCVTYIDFS